MDYAESYAEYLKQSRRCFVFDLSKILSKLYYSEEKFVNLDQDRLVHEFVPDPFFYKLFPQGTASEEDRVRYRQTLGMVVQFFYLSLKAMIVDQVPIQVTINTFGYTKPMDFMNEAGLIIFEGKNFGHYVQPLWDKLEENVKGYQWHHTHIVIKRGLLLVKFEGDKRICDWYEEHLSKSVSDGD